ncbi:SLC13 family permease [Maridesulfovibrio zosterae]|uniref:SLC13 family permease n=1 Tax=Maridesulfovibrio zosterae TaxID=82171 RepID=UPI00040A94DA|nr:anion permease [Maridesulfovibrio zosterae]
MSTASPPSETPLSQKIGWILSFVIPALILVTVHGDGLTREMVIFMAITSWAVICWATEILPAPMVGIILPTLYFATKVAPPQVALGKAFTTVIPWAIIGALLIGLMAYKTGLAKRLVLKCMVLTGSSYYGLFFALFISGMLLTILVPSGTAKSTIMLALGVGACDALNLKKGSRESTAVLFAAFLSVCAPRFGLLTGSLENLAVTRLMSSVTGVSISYADYAIQNFIPATIYCALSMCLLLFMVKGKGKLKKELLLAQYEEMGPISQGEWISAFIAVSAVVLAATQKLHGIPILYLFMAFGIPAFIPKYRILDQKDFNTLAFPMLFFITGSLSIGFVAGHIGIGKWLCSLLLPVAQSMESVFGLSTLAYSFGAIFNFILTPLSAQALMTVPLSELAVSLHVQPYPIVYSFLYGTDQYIFAYEFALLLFFCSTGHLRLRYAMKVLAFRMLAFPIFLGTIAVPYWTLIGIV